MDDKILVKTVNVWSPWLMSVTDYKIWRKK